MGSQLAGLLQRPGVPENPPPYDGTEAMLTVKQVARAFKAHPQTVRGMLNRGDLRGFRVGRVWRISRQEVIDKSGLPEDHDFGSPD